MKQVKVKQVKDIFISYKNDNAGNNFARRLTDDLEAAGYSVYFNSDEQKGGKFPDRLRENIINCKDFVLIVSQGCLEQITDKDKTSRDWITEELLTAKEHEKHIIPIILENVVVSADENVWPEELKFMVSLDYVYFTERYKTSPFGKFTSFLHSRQEKDDIYRDVCNENPDYNVAEALERIQISPESGWSFDESITLKYKLGIMYYYGFSSADGKQSERNLEKAAQCFREISHNAELFLSGSGVSPKSQKYINSANYFLGRMYYAGLIPREEQSYFKAYEYHKKAESDQYDINTAEIVFMERSGLGCTFDYAEINNTYHQLTEQNPTSDKSTLTESSDDISKGAYADFLYKYGRFKEAIAVYESMQYLSVNGAYYLGIMYRNGVHTMDDANNIPPQPDYYKASYYFQEAADRNHTRAAFELAMLNFRPFEHHRKNFPKALRYFKIAAEKGNSEAQYMLGYMYENGHVEVDFEKAINYYEQAAAQDHALAALQLATLYQQPVRQNYHRAFLYAKKATNSGVAEAEFILGNLLLFGRGCLSDVNEALRHYQNAAAHGIVQAEIMIEEVHNCYRKNPG